MVVAECAGLLLVVQRKNSPTNGVFQGEQASDGKMEIVSLDGGFSFVEINAAVWLVFDGLGLHAAQNGGASAFIAVVMGGLAAAWVP